MSFAGMMHALRFAARLRQNTSGVAAVEFMFLAPVLVVMMFGIVDFGNVHYMRFRLADGVAAASVYAVARASDVSTANATDLARSIATLVGNSNGNGWAKARVVVNNGPVGTNDSGEASATTTVPGATNGLCYCPNSSSDFGQQLTCGTSCSSGGVAGRYVMITARRAYTPIFSSYGVAADGFITVSNMVQTE